MKWSFLLVLVACSLGRAADVSRLPPLILVSLDGFRWDYLDLYPNETPTLRALRQNGVTARGLIPVFPSNTFPNHYSIVTGLYPAHHGIINNDFFDAQTEQFFRFNQPTSNDSAWWGGEPIWITAVKQGRKAATSFWVGSESEIGGRRPTFWKKYDGRLTFETRLEELMEWMSLPEDERPSFLGLYMEETNGAGHRYGPNSPEVAAAIRLCDERLAALLARLAAAKIEANLLVVSDHGMTPTSEHRVVIIDDLIELETVQVEAYGSVLALRPKNGDAAALVRRFEKIPRATAYLASELPAHFSFTKHPRIAPVWVVPDEGWHVGTRAAFERTRAAYAQTGYMQGDHGYDPELVSMHGILIAHGPSFRRGVELPEVENIHLYNLMCAAMNLAPAQNDGDNRLVRAVLLK